MEELRTMTDDYATLSLKYKKIKEKMQDLEESGRKLYDENEKLKSDISVSAS
jgi:cell shape-determining protein MreC